MEIKKAGDFFWDLSEIPKEVRDNSAAAFRKSGGLWIRQIFLTPHVRVRLSGWADPQGYDRWENDSWTELFLRMRDQLNLKHGIGASRVGPLNSKDIFKTTADAGSLAERSRKPSGFAAGARGH